MRRVRSKLSEQRLPARYELGLGNKRTQYNDLKYRDAWKLVKEEGGLFRAKLSIGHAPDAHTPYTWKSDYEARPGAEKAALKQAKELIASGQAQFSQVTLSVWHTLTQQRVTYTLGWYEYEASCGTTKFLPCGLEHCEKCYP